MIESIWEGKKFVENIAIIETLSPGESKRAFMENIELSTGETVYIMAWNSLNYAKMLTNRLASYTMR